MTPEEHAHIVEITTVKSVSDMWLALTCRVPALCNWDDATEDQRMIARKFFASGVEDLRELARLLGV